MTPVKFQLRPDGTAVLPVEFPNGSDRGLTISKVDALGSLLIIVYLIQHHALPEVLMRRFKKDSGVRGPSEIDAPHTDAV
jgi:hypothetical protein